MKTNFTQSILCLLTILFIIPSKAAVSPYTFVSTSGTYTAITGTTLFASTTTTRWDDAVSSLQTIPFTFTYNGVGYTTLGVNSNGYITMGAVSTASTNYCGVQGSEANSIAGYATDLVGGSLATTSNVVVGSRGTAPNRQYVIQWNDCSHWTSATYTDHWTFQIILNETTNTVQIVWGNSTNATTMGANTCADAATESGSVGLLGNANTDFNIRSVTNGTNTWATSIAGTTINAVCNMSSTNIPANGLTYTWTPGVAIAMSYTSSTTSFLNNALGLPRSATNNQIIQIQVKTSGSLTPFSVSSIALATSGCTNASADISNAKVYYTGLSTTFATTTQFGSTTTSPNGAFTVTGTATLAEGVNNFWLCYDIKSTANFGDIISACCTQIVGSGAMGTVTPTITCPTGSQLVYQVGIWVPVAATAPHPNKGHMLLLSDGTAICKSSGGGTDGLGNIWDKLTPDINGSYVNGTWSSIAPMVNTRLFFSSQVLKDGRVYVAGGEYGTGLAAGEVYNPLTNTWTLTPAPGANISDANSEILENGNVLQAVVAGALTGTKIYNPTTNTYSTGPTARGIHNESAWLKLPDNSILYVDRLSTSSERYIPATNTWIADGTVPVSLYDPYGDETGAAFLLPNGKAFFLGALGHTAFYTPTGTTSPGTWTAGPDIPSGKGTPDAAAAMMMNGKIICAVSPAPTSANHFPTPTTFYEFDYTTNSFILLNAPGNVASLNIGSYQTNFLDLPDGSVLYAQNQTSTSSQYYIYKPAGTQLTAGKPAINNITQITCDSFSITGTLFNGISQGACYGDDGQMSTNYPVIRLTSGSNVYYARTSFWNSTGVQRGSSPDTTKFKLPAGLPAGTYSLVVTANGISSDPVSFTANPTLSSTLTPSTICSGTSFTYTPTSARTNATFTWTRAAVTGISNAAISTTQSVNPNEVLINTTSNPINVVYAYTITAGACSNTQNVIVVVNAGSSGVTPSVSISTATTTVCNNNAVNFTATGANTGSAPIYNWIKNGTSVGSSSSITFVAGTLATGDSISCVLTANNACQTTATASSNKIKLTVKPSPTIGTSTAAIVCTIGGTVNLYNTVGGGVWSSNNTNIATATNVTNSSTGIANAIANGTANISYTITGSNGCNAVATSTVMVASIAVPSAITGATSLCIGSNTTLSDITTGGVWSSIVGRATINASGIVTGLNAGVATIKYTVSNSSGCSNAASYNITVNSLPNIPSINYATGTINPQTGAGGAFCANKIFTVVGSPSGGVWSKTGVISVTSLGGLVTTGSIAGAGSLTYTYTDGFGCSNSRTIIGNVVACASRGVNNGQLSAAADDNGQWTIYPNPAKSFISLNVKTLIGAGTIVVTDLYGKQVKAQALSIGTNTIDVASFAKGIYFVSTTTNEGKTTKKLVVE